MLSFSGGSIPNRGRYTLEIEILKKGSIEMKKNFKRFLSLLFACLLLLGVMSACNSAPKDDDTQVVESSATEPDPTPKPDAGTDLGSDTETDEVGGPIEGVDLSEAYDLPAENAFVEVDGKKVSLPCSYNDFMALGFTLPEESEPETPELEGHTHGSLEVSSGEEGIHVGITLYNPDEDAKDFKECMIYSCIVDTYEAEFAPSKVKLGDISYEDTPDTMIKRYGNPTGTYGGYGSDMYTWANELKTKGMDASFSQESGKLYSASIVNYTWELPDPTPEPASSAADSSAVESGAESVADSTSSAAE